MRKQLRFQLTEALNLDIPVDRIREAFIQVAVFAGNARAINEAAMLKQIVGTDKKE